MLSDLQEAKGYTRLIAGMLGWPYADERMQVIAHSPLARSARREQALGLSFSR
ncbi:MAG: hypothetical protein U0031_00180 [Thermomicrobiales bacterium]